MTCLTPTKMGEIVAEVQGFKSRRMKILQALKLVLNTITVNNGYSRDIYEASFENRLENSALWCL